MATAGLLVACFIVLSTHWMKDMRLLEVSPRVWKIEIKNKKCVALLQGREMTVGQHVISFILGFCSGEMAVIIETPWPSG